MIHSRFPMASILNWNTNSLAWHKRPLATHYLQFHLQFCPSISHCASVTLVAREKCVVPISGPLYVLNPLPGTLFFHYSPQLLLNIFRSLFKLKCQVHGKNFFYVASWTDHSYAPLCYYPGSFFNLVVNYWWWSYLFTVCLPLKDLWQCLCSISIHGKNVMGVSLKFLSLDIPSCSFALHQVQAFYSHKI